MTFQFSKRSEKSLAGVNADLISLARVALSLRSRLQSSAAMWTCLMLWLMKKAPNSMIRGFILKCTCTLRVLFCIFLVSSLSRRSPGTPVFTGFVRSLSYQKWWGWRELNQRPKCYNYLFLL